VDKYPRTTSLHTAIRFWYIQELLLLRDECWRHAYFPFDERKAVWSKEKMAWQVMWRDDKTHPNLLSFVTLIISGRIPRVEIPTASAVRSLRDSDGSSSSNAGHSSSGSSTRVAGMDEGADLDKGGEAGSATSLDDTEEERDSPTDGQNHDSAGNDMPPPPSPCTSQRRVVV